MAALISIVDSKYCLPNSINLKIDTKEGVVYFDNNVEFKVEEPFFSLHSRLVLHDAAGNPIVTLYKKIVTMHERWEVFKGDSTDSNDLIFSAKRKDMIQWGIIKLEVFLANNRQENVCDFKMDAKFLKQSCVVYAGQSSKIIAKMQKNFRGNYKVTVNPHTDYAFIGTLIVILDNIHHVDELTNSTFRIARMAIDPFDTSGLFLTEMAENIAEYVVENIVENTIESTVTN